MCARFELNVAPADLLARFGLTAPPEDDAVTGAALDRLPRAEIRPTDRVPVIGPRRVPVALSWGVRVDWDPKPLINARAETLAAKPTFRPFVGNRCLVPATAFFEWTDPPAGAPRGRKRRHRIGRDDAPLYAMAGLVDDRGRFTVITRPATDRMAALHHRMPAILAGPDAEVAWLDPARPFADVQGLLTDWDGPLVITDDGAPEGAAGQADLFA
ncbi:SOS response-associated peptidase [Roseospira goensis]|uniref:Abasic site processing protein n=1 Tax=Roseospira goensis TaxID=391922 RepID=A0A7W6RYJ1_9PROT|nr:SOS response-associated peptidase [Roseospira goensis]MBB4285618.1 putative SOS response-associated peptidase YedK [Roseospira goensis]